MSLSTVDPEQQKAGRHTCCPIDRLLNLLSGPWTMYILWVLQSQGPMRFGALKRHVEGISTKVLTERLRMLEAEGLLYRAYVPTVPPEVTYGLAERMKDLTEVLEQLNAIAQRWYGQKQLPLE
jgi:DNA-binding HxlR family transcriptional regulator